MPVSFAGGMSDGKRRASRCSATRAISRGAGRTLLQLIDGPALRPGDVLAAGGTPTALVHDAHAVGLQVHPYTFRPENTFLAKDFWQGDQPNTFNAAGMVAELTVYLATGIDAFFTDDPAPGREAVGGR